MLDVWDSSTAPPSARSRTSWTCSGSQKVTRNRIAQNGYCRKLISLFRDEVGLTPKVFARICRLRQVLRRIDGASDIDWADTALACGYFDQAHFVHDFHALVGLTPTTYARHRTTNLNHVRVP